MLAFLASASAQSQRQEAFDHPQQPKDLLTTARYYAPSRLPCQVVTAAEFSGQTKKKRRAAKLLFSPSVTLGGMERRTV
ncbi:hypothetical protein VTO42DRAFT_538 [Malbranchea cinnamomea]